MRHLDRTGRRQYDHMENDLEEGVPVRPTPLPHRPARHRAGYRLKHPGRLALLALACLLAGGLAWWGLGGLARGLAGLTASGAPAGAERVSAPAAVLKSPPAHVVWVLLIGTDGSEAGGGPAGAVLLARANRENQQVRLLCLPAETRVHLPGHGSTSLGAAYALGGPDLTRQAVESLLGEEVAYYVKAGAGGFGRLVDLLGGVRVAVDRPMQNAAAGIDLQPGVQLLNGERALQFLRFRHADSGDHDDPLKRCDRQQLFLRALAEQRLTVELLAGLPALLAEAAAAVETNIPAAEQLALAQVAFSARDWIESVTAPGEGLMAADGTWHYVLDREKLDRRLAAWANNE